MKTRVIFVERKRSEAVSIERVFRQIARDLPEDFEVEFASVPFGTGVVAIVKNLLFFRPPAADIYHITGDVHYISLLLPPSRTVLTIHDLVFLHRRTGLRRFVLKKLYLDLPLRRLRHVTVISQAIRDEIVDQTGVEAGRLTLIENPLFEGFAADREKPFDDICPTILHIGTAENKNLANLIKAVEGINCELRIIGQLDDKIVRILNDCGTKYDNVRALNDDQIIEEYRNADIVSLCSLYEGFGLPIIEAQALKKPVITSDLPPMNDVAGEGAELVDPYDIDSIRVGLRRLIDDPGHRNTLVEVGVENVKRFDRRSVAGKYAEVYRQIAKRVEN